MHCGSVGGRGREIEGTHSIHSTPASPCPGFLNGLTGSREFTARTSGDCGINRETLTIDSPIEDTTPGIDISRVVQLHQSRDYGFLHVYREKANSGKLSGAESEPIWGYLSTWHYICLRFPKDKLMQHRCGDS